MFDHFRSRNTALSDEAIRWIVRMGGSPTANERAAFAQWCLRSPAHAEAVRRARALLDDTGRTQLAAEHRQWVRALSREPRRRVSRRTFLVGGASAAAVAGLAAAGLSGPGLSAADLSGAAVALFADQRTATGERRRWRLPDGSQAWLNTGSALSAAFTPDRRQASLLAGEVLFEVGSDSRRPFIVQCRDGEVRVRDGRCCLRREARRSVLTVLAGSADVRTGAGETRVAADQRVAFSSDVLGLVESVDADAATAWVRGKLIFNRQPLAQVAAEVERYTTRHIRVVGENLRHLQLSGVFDLDDTDALLRAVAALAGARIVRLPLITLIR